MAVAWVYESEEGLNEFMVRHDVTTTDQYQLSPVRPVKERQTKELRIRLSDDSFGTHFNVEEEYRADGLTDYIVLSLASPRVRDDVVTFATKEVGGFSEKHLQLLRTAASALEQHSHQVAWAIYERLEAVEEPTDTEAAILPISSSDDRFKAFPSLRLDNPHDQELVRELGYRLSALERIETPIWIFDVHRMQLLWGNHSAVVLWNAEDSRGLLTRVSDIDHARDETPDLDDVRACPSRQWSTNGSRSSRGENRSGFISPISWFIWATVTHAS